MAPSGVEHKTDGN